MSRKVTILRLSFIISGQVIISDAKEKQVRNFNIANL